MAPASVPALEVSALSKHFGGVPALVDLDLTLSPGRVHALLGQNGSGKSTLIKLLSGYHTPEPRGHMAVAGVRMRPGSPADAHRLGCRFVHQDLGLVDELSVADNLCLGGGYPTRMLTIARRATLVRAAAQLRAAGVDADPSRPLGELPPAARTGVAMARALRPDSRFPVAVLVLDEPSATLPAAERAHLHELVRTVAAQGVAVLYVTHHLGEVFELADHVTVLRDGRKVHTGPTEALDHSTLIGHLTGDEAPALPSEPPGPVQPSEPVLIVRDLVTAGVHGVSFEVAGGEIVGMAGLTGSGRESVLPAVFGALSRHGGDVTVGSTALRPNRPRSAIDSGVAYLPANRIADGACMALTARENLTLADITPFWRFPAIRTRAESSETSSWFRRLDIRPSSAAERHFETFSGGNQQKILFAKWLRRQPVLLLLEEPTQGVDVGAKVSLHRAVTETAARGTAVLVSSSDSEELLSLCQRIMVLRDGCVVADLAAGGLSASTLTAAMMGVVGSSS